jgi:hypothetical protein
MPPTRVLLACLLAIAYLVILLSGSLVHIAGSGDGFMLRVNARYPLTWAAAIVAGIVAWGLWQRYSWAWWLGVAGALVQLFRLGRAHIMHASLAKPPSLYVLLLAGLLVVFLVLLFTAPARAACSR